MQETSSRWSRLGLALLGNVVLYCLLNGFMAVYVSEKTVRMDAVIGDSDLAEYESTPIVMSDRASSADTIIRSAMLMADATAENAAGQCSRPSPRRLPAQLNYGYPSRQWLSEMLPYAPETTDANTLIVSLNDDVKSTDIVTMPMEPTAARNLVGYALRATDDFYREQDVQANASAFELLDLPENFDSASSEDARMTHALVKATNATLNRAVKTRSHLRNFSIAESSLEFVKFPWTTDSGELVFEGVTFEIPMDKGYLRREVKLLNDTTQSVVYGSQALDGSFEINAKEECGRYGCVVSPVGAALTTAPADEGSQHGVVKHKLSKTALAFDSSVNYVDITLSVPQLSAMLTLVGCASLVIMAVLIFFGGKSREADIERNFKPHHLARILLDDDAFSHRLLKCDLLNVGNKYLNSSELLDQFEISGLALRHRKRPSDVLIVPNGHQSSTQSAASSQAANIV
ncbi:hypothetical protein PInf_014556 [Phytophthora infestans]|nr:hypothetical protein PInf_014556 [Phytophthora infestans]